MSKIKSVIGVMMLLIIAVACGDEDQEVVTLEELVFADEFDVDGAPNPDIWAFELGDGCPDLCGWGNNELQYYSDRPENVTIRNGVMIITAREESFEGAGYTSARLLTKDLFEQQYGRFEARIQIPWGQGLWPAFWMLGADIAINPWPGAGEIDIMENRGSEPTKIEGTVHGPGYSGGESIGKSYELTNDRFDTGFHVFGIEWEPESIRFYVDDALYNEITPEDVPGEWVFNKPCYMLLNVAVGGDFGGPPNGETVFPQTMLIDYVRVYR